VTWLARALVLVAALQLAACAGVSPRRQQQAQAYADQARSSEVACAATPCAAPSPLLELGDAAMAASAPGAPRHSVVLLDAGQDSLLARVHLIQSARRSIDLQTFHFEQDDAGRLVLDALMDAARRGVRVRLLMDQLSGLDEARIWSHLAGFHRNFELRMYNPLFRKAQFGPLEFTAALVFQFGSLNRRMHNKAMVVDGTVGIVGGRNIQDEYFDWHPGYDYRDRDILVAGPAAQEITANFDAFWNDQRTLEPAELSDVASMLIRQKGPEAELDMPARSPRVEAMAHAASDPAAVYARLAPYRVDVGQVDYIGDLPSKHDAAAARYGQASQAMRDIVEGTREELLLQTPYLVMSRPARQLFRQMQARDAPPRIRVSTNSLAATDAFPAYAMSHKYKRLYLRELGFEIHEYKPFPYDMPLVPEATGAFGAAAATAATERAAVAGVACPAADGGAIAMPPADGRAEPPPPLEDAVTASTAPDPGTGLRRFRRLGPVPLKRAGLRIGLHAKSLVVDRRIAVVGSHNFDPRSDEFNTESMVVVHDAAFADRLARSIERDMAPGNAWVIAPREKLPILWGLNYNLGKLSEKLPVFDIWPLPYATSYELRPGCAPRPPTAPDFHDCYRAVGDFPEVNLGLKGIYTRVLTVFGAGLIPIL
jgi:phosphatidylserine/phosphatidylglycerophosphate/cardiolipin synthase-like enzyme